MAIFSRTRFSMIFSDGLSRSVYRCILVTDLVSIHYICVSVLADCTYIRWKTKSVFFFLSFPLLLDACDKVFSISNPREKDENELEIVVKQLMSEIELL